MIEQDALGIVKSLADGVDPVSGEVFPADSPYQNVQIVRALLAAVNALENSVRRKNRKTNLPERAGKPWNKTESDLLIQKFDNGISLVDLAKEHKRTRGAIQAQLAKLGKIELPYVRKN
ncbi:MAG: hypothetical protein ABR969_09540 [Sedimentisphaerales bacterium]|jgi:hypothetical protein